MDPKCWLVDGLFVVGFVASTASYFVGRRAHEERVANAPPFAFWRMGWDLYRSELFTAAGERLRRRALRLSWLGGACLIIVIALVFALRGEETGICWFKP